ncbi:hypothetical protein LINPERPRIM_LOCUS3784 [Linum perenne]
MRFILWDKRLSRAALSSAIFEISSSMDGGGECCSTLWG